MHNQVLLTVALVVVACAAAATTIHADILFGTYSPPRKQNEPERFLAMNDWLQEKGTQPFQTVRVMDVGWGPQAKIHDQIANIANVWRWDTAVPVLSWMPYGYKTWLSPTPNQDIVSGLYDDYIDTFLTTLSTLFIYADVSGVARRCYLRFAPQPNSNWAPWSPFCPPCANNGQAINQTVASYKAMWNYVITKVRNPKYKLTTDVLQVIFDVSAVDLSGKIEDFYPGSGALSSPQWLGVTGDNFGDALPGNSWISAQKLLQAPIERLNALDATLPVAITSAATTSNPNGVGAKNSWVADLISFTVAAEKANNVKMMSYHNSDDATDFAIFGGGAGLTNWSSPVSQWSYYVYPAFRDGVTAAPFVGTNSSNVQYITDEQFEGSA